MDRTMIKNLLENCAEDSGASDDYCRGILVASIALFMAYGFTFDGAKSVILENLPSVHRRRDLASILPESWLEAFQEA